MVRSELIARIASDHDLTIEMAETVVRTVFGEIAGALEAGNRVELRGFGSFSVRRRGERNAHNPRTGEKVRVDSKHVPVFVPGKRLRDRLNGRG
ncbi:MAG: integration host factor subunit beta [Paracoccaceae bacterium]|nr:integration host factor subunit beta [Paracoccaceae bacterium]MDE2915158.1 integration host factor subunit beta [Paracoccaceae bacterium]